MNRFKILICALFAVLVSIASVQCMTATITYPDGIICILTEFNSTHHARMWFDYRAHNSIEIGTIQETLDSRIDYWMRKNGTILITK